MLYIHYSLLFYMQIGFAGVKLVRFTNSKIPLTLKFVNPYSFFQFQECSQVTMLCSNNISRGDCGYNLHVRVGIGQHIILRNYVNEILNNTREYSRCEGLAPRRSSEKNHFGCIICSFQNTEQYPSCISMPIFILYLDMEDWCIPSNTLIHLSNIFIYYI